MNKHLDRLIKFSDLETGHPALSYIEKRQIPEQHWDKLYFAEKFYEWSHTIFPEKFKSIKEVVVDGICAESDQDTKDQKEFAEWKAKKKKEEEEEIPF